MRRMSHWKWRETEQQLIWLLVPFLLGYCIASLHFQYDSLRMPAPRVEVVLFLHEKSQDFKANFTQPLRYANALQCRLINRCQALLMPHVAQCHRINCCINRIRPSLKKTLIGKCDPSVLCIPPSGAVSAIAQCSHKERPTATAVVTKVALN